MPVDAEQACTFANPQGNTPRDGILFLDGSRGSNGRSSTPGRSGSLDPVPNFDQTPLGSGNLAGLGSSVPWSAAHQRSVSDPLFDWLQMALADNGTRLLAGTLPSWTPQPVETREPGAFSPAFPQTQTTPQQAAPGPRPIESLLPVVLKPLVSFFFPQGLEPNNALAWPPTSPSDGPPAQLNPAGNAGASLGLAPAPLMPQQLATPSPIDAPLPLELMPLVRLLFP